MTKSHVVIFVALISILAGCASSTSKLTKHEASDTHRIVYGKFIDLNPESIPSELELTYTTEEQAKNGILSFDKFPMLEPKTNFWWVRLPKDAKYFGVSSIRFKIKGVEGKAIIRDDRNHQPLFGSKLAEGNAPVYFGDITIRSGMRKYTAGGITVEGFDLKEASIKDNSKIAREFLDKNGIDSNELVINPAKLKNTQEAKAKPVRRSGRF